MTKRLVIAVIFLTAALSGSIFSFVLVQSVFDEMLEIADNAVTAQEDEFFALTERLISLWDKNGRSIEIILKHTDADTLEKYFILLGDMAETKNKDGTVRLLRELSAFITVTAEGEKPEIQNIF